jgi:serine/threonine protein kinase
MQVMVRCLTFFCGGLILQLGEGSFSVVKEGTQKETGRSYAIKIVSNAKLSEAEEAKLKEEIAIMQELKHPNIIRLYDVYTEPDYFLVTEKMAGGDLLSRINGMAFLGERQGRRVCTSILEAVRYMHSKKIAHRDLKPENILLDDSDSDNVIVKVGDFGFAKREELPNSFTTMCGTAAYVAPEILRAEPYGIAADLWSVGIIAYILLVGYQPFRGEDDDTLHHQIRDGVFEFDEKFWSNITSEAKAFIASVLKVDPAERLSANEALAHKWFTLEDLGKAASQNETPVFFMIGSQRSGSNWLRTMLDEREDLVGPHPPHMLRDFMPIIDKFGDLSTDHNLKVLVDHVCTFVERNQVPWTDKHGQNIKFPRSLINAAAAESCERLRMNRVEGGKAHALESGIYLLGVFDAIMNFFTQANGKRTWMCKSMGISQFHDILLEFYGEKRLRYIYLVRDPRDVAMSFMKT